MQYFNQRTGNLRKCVRSEETCQEGASKAYFRTLEKPLGQRFAGDDGFYQRFLIKTRAPKNFETRVSFLSCCLWYGASRKAGKGEQYVEARL